MKLLPSGSRILLAVAMLAVVGACGGDDASDTPAADNADASASGGGSEDRTHQQMSAEELEIWQTDLNAVGCWAGPVDGRLGPQTQAAVEAFQAAKGLEVDGILGPQTEGALEEAVEAGETVCASSVDSNEAGDRSLASLSSASYEKDFALGTCSSSGESDIELAAESDNITLTVSANMADFTEAGGAGALRVEGGTESDGITLNGTVESVSVGDAGDFTVRGVFGPPNHDGEEFNLTGSCG